MDGRTVAYILKQKDILNPNRNIFNSYLKVKPHNRYETFEHFMIKAAIAFTIFSRNGDGFLTEAETKSGRCLDVLNVRDANNLIAYEIESEKNEKFEVNGVDIIEVKLSRLSLKMKGCLKEMKKWAQEIVV